MNELTIVMYHYVRPINGSNFPGIKGLELDGFKRQLDYLNSQYNIVNTQQVIDAYIKNKKIPSKACWLTFDDGYKDHYKYVLPELLKRNLHGAFFPPRVAIEDNIVLDVNLIQHIISCANNIDDLVSKLNTICIMNDISKKELKLFYKKLAVANRFDNEKIIYVKRMLQHALPEKLRNTITLKLFEEFVGVSPKYFSKKLYMNIDEVSEIVKKGMYVGSHGSMHYWLDRISLHQQEKDILSSLEFLERIGTSTKNWVMCYPYGAYNDNTLHLLKKYQASIGLTTEFRVANLIRDKQYTLPRLDTNDFPQ